MSYFFQVLVGGDVRLIFASHPGSTRFVRRAKTTFYRKSKELGRATGDNQKVGELHDEAPATKTPDVDSDVELRVVFA
ncbi:hypothetical protein Sjap_022873 [Stephania japonica]|uniref:Uncharacterized protein n=1 Tax=Stephania japonica TaxID=461633 RepID=A0AAP0EQ77_9MAGN